ncbi:hypothetical protein [Clostridium cadaveris]
MEFITVEQFKEQPLEVQKVFLDWWKPSIGDIFMDLAPNSKKKLLAIEDKGNCVDIELIKREVIPLLTEGQIRRFIEDKKGEIVEIDLYCGGYSIVTEYRNFELGNLGRDLLQAYWKAAYKIASEEIKLEF